MDCREFRDLVPALALDALDDSERAACAAHLTEVGPHDGCQQAEADARALAARLAGALPARAVAPRVWHGIEERARADKTVRAASAARRTPSRWRELAGWVFAAAMLSLYLIRRPPTDAPRIAGAATATPPLVCERAVTLMMNRDMRRFLFRPAPSQPAAARGALIFDPGERTALVLVDRVAPSSPGQRLRLWAVRGPGTAPALLAGFAPASTGIAIAGLANAAAAAGTMPGGANLATAEIGSALFEPALPGSLLLSSDATEASAPGTVLLMADLAN